MIILAYIVFTFTIIQLTVAVVNLLYRPLKQKYSKNYSGLVSVLIPARNEEHNIANLLNNLLNQDYKNIEIIVFNDQSTDKTEAIVTEFAQSDKRIKLLNSTNLPKGWLGKNYACYCLAQKAQGDYFLFLDADVRLKGGIISDTVNLAKNKGLGLISIFPKQLMLSIGEYLTVPNMNYILLSLLPLPLVHKSKMPSLAAANGQFMLFSKDKYLETSPHQVFKSNKVEDIETSIYFKQKNIPMVCMLGDDRIECRMYDNFKTAINGFSKNAINFFGKSWFAATLFWLLTTFGAIAVFAWLNNLFIGIYIASVILIRLIISLASKQNIILNTLLIIPQQLAFGLILYKALITNHKRDLQWKGRNIY